MNRDQDDQNELPCYSRPWDRAQAILAGRRYRIEDIGILSDGGALCAICVAIAPGVI